MKFSTAKLSWSHDDGFYLAPATILRASKFKLAKIARDIALSAADENDRALIFVLQSLIKMAATYLLLGVRPKAPRMPSLWK